MMGPLQSTKKACQLEDLYKTYVQCSPCGHTCQNILQQKNMIFELIITVYNMPIAKFYGPIAHNSTGLFQHSCCTRQQHCRENSSLDVL